MNNDHIFIYDYKKTNKGHFRTTRKQKKTKLTKIRLNEKSN